MSEYAYVLMRGGEVIAMFKTDDDAMNLAQDCGYLRPAKEEEGGPQFSVLREGFSLERVGY